MTVPPRIFLWRCAATVLWIASLICLARALYTGAIASETLYNPGLTAAARAALEHTATIADRLSDIGWLLQLLTAATMSAGLTAPRVARRTFVALCILIAADGTALLLFVVIRP